jgi:C4-dicarboxylate transporter, DctM subunit
VLMVLNSTIGMITPPYGGNLFIGTSIAGVTMAQFMKYFWVLFIGLVIVLMIVTYVPAVSTCLIGKVHM